MKSSKCARRKVIAGAMLFATLPMASKALAAHTLDNTSLTIDGTAPVEQWTLKNEAQLNIIDDGHALVVNGNNSTLTMDGGLLASASLTDNSTANFDNAVVRIVAAPFSTAFTLSKSTAVANKSLFFSTGYGIDISQNSALTLVDSSVTAQSGVGVGVRDSVARIEDNSIIVGQMSGVKISAAAGKVSSLRISDSLVTGMDGAAIDVKGVGAAGEVNIEVLDNTVLKTRSDSGNLINISQGFTTHLLVDNSVLNGNIVSAENAYTELTVGNHAHILGQISNVDKVTINDSTVVGNIAAAPDDESELELNHSVLTGQLSDIDRLKINSSVWNVSDSSQVGNAALHDTVINFTPNLLRADDYRTLHIDDLSGNATFVMNTDIGSGKGDLLTTNHATGSFHLAIKNTGLEPQDSNYRHQVVDGTSGNATYSLLSGKSVDVGTYQYDLTQDGQDWYLTQVKDSGGGAVVTPVASAVLDIYRSSGRLLLAESDSIHQRLQGTRDNTQKKGLWLQGYTKEFEEDSFLNQSNLYQQHGATLGADMSLDEYPVTLGLFVGESKSDVGLNTGNDDAKSYYLGAYSTVKSDTGYYLDTIVKFNKTDRNPKVTMSDGTVTKGKTSYNSATLSVEAGREFALPDDYFVSPFVRATTSWIEGDSVEMDNGLTAKADGQRVTEGKIGSLFGTNIRVGNVAVKPYVAAAYTKNQYKNKNEVSVNDNKFDSDLSSEGYSVEFGVSTKLNNSWKVQVSAEHSEGNNYDEPWGANVTVNYLW
ncbi:autotransporter outer membrane beta-barrel domain-containing protein [Pseudomonas sp. NPDC089569]|uniref:autotransporter outer membrane beta-barrel domain-containing protein n=1 Tax=Pseudomonas sp. NPDC089569 TaxID=3390722 RepID=UPI003CFDA9FF